MGRVVCVLKVTLIDIELTRPQLQTIVEILIGVGEIFFASWAISPIITGDFDLTLELLGFVLSFISWYVSLIISKKIKENYE